MLSRDTSNIEPLCTTSMLLVCFKQVCPLTSSLCALTPILVLVIYSNYTSASYSHTRVSIQYIHILEKRVSISSFDGVEGSALVSNQVGCIYNGEYTLHV